ncbi:MAG: tRNA preQ1(34) S-adenosylmethionine ribosyltransferase-isomerase QueA [Candidatus Sericytochromatia bacterium]|nr:tRNA preQ1(34) S-adenosylmethionine ribosyltransferase-isomerase QueA [Candidatus Sericytochromatia bacterium]
MPESIQQEDLLLSAYDFELPEALIAQTPADRRDQSRLLVYDRQTRRHLHRHFYDLPELLQPGDLLVMNNTRVFPARIFGQKSHTGTRFEFLLTRQTASLTWQAMAKNSKRIKPGYVFVFSETVSAEIVNCEAGGLVELHFKGIEPEAFFGWLDQHGEIPYPPYITARTSSQDRYQTVFSRSEGSVAAPTAGLHFTPELLAQLHQRGINSVEVTLHIGMGTFAPVRSERIDTHPLHHEWYSLSENAAEKLNVQRQAGGRIIAVGTTSVRTLESVWRKHGMFQAEQGETNIFIYPGQKIAAIDGLITNFHLPRSSLLMLVSTWIGRKNLLKLYQNAIEAKYRFYSFGDACLLL